MNLTNWQLFFLCLLIVACERSLPFPEAVPPVLVANAIVSTDSIWHVQLTQSAPLEAEINFPSINKGQIIIKDITEGTAIELIPQSNGIYISDTQSPEANHSYQLIAMAEGYPTIQATDQMPTPFKATVNSFETSTYQQRNNYLFDITIEDANNKTNFYLIAITYEFDLGSQYIVEPAGHFSFDPNSDNEQVVPNHSSLKQSYLPDYNFNGQNYTTQVGTTSPSLEQIDSATKVLARIHIKSISAAGYQYELSVERFENIADDLFTDPIGVFSNIENGLGIFAGYTLQEIIIPIK